MRRWLAISSLALCAALTACGGGGTELIKVPASSGVQQKTPQAAQKLGFPAVATKNTTRVSGGDPIADAAGVALAVYPSSTSDTHPAAVTLAPTDSWQAAIASAAMMAPPLRAPILLSGSGSLPASTADALRAMAPSGSGATGGAQLIRVGSVPARAGMRSVAIGGADAYAVAAGIDRFVSAAQGKTSSEVIVTSAEDPAYAMPAAGWAAESGDPVLFVNHAGIPAATRQALLSHQRPRIYVLGPVSAVPEAVVTKLRAYGRVRRVGASDPAANSVAFTEYRDPPCAYGQPCAHIPGSFGWALRSPGHGYVLLNAHRPLDAAAAAALSGSGDYGPQLLLDDPSTLPAPVLNYFLNYATPGYTQEGPTAAVYNHAWVIGDAGAISPTVQAQVDARLEVVPQSSSTGGAGGPTTTTGKKK